MLASDHAPQVLGSQTAIMIDHGWGTTFRGRVRGIGVPARVSIVFVPGCRVALCGRRTAGKHTIAGREQASLFGPDKTNIALQFIRMLDVPEWLTLRRRPDNAPPDIHNQQRRPDLPCMRVPAAY